MIVSVEVVLQFYWGFGKGLKDCVNPEMTPVGEYLEYCLIFEPKISTTNDLFQQILIPAQRFKPVIYCMNNRQIFTFHCHKTFSENFAKLFHKTVFTIIIIYLET